MSESQMDAIVGRATAQVNLLEDALAGLHHIKARATSKDDEVTAEVDGNGTLVGLWMNDSVTKLDARTVATLVTETSQAAATLASEQRMQVLTRLQDSFESPEA